LHNEALKGDTIKKQIFHLSFGISHCWRFIARRLERALVPLLRGTEKFAF